MLGEDVNYIYYSYIFVITYSPPSTPIRGFTTSTLLQLPQESKGPHGPSPASRPARSTRAQWIPPTTSGGAARPQDAIRSDMGRGRRSTESKDHEQSPEMADSHHPSHELDLRVRTQSHHTSANRRACLGSGRSVMVLLTPANG